MANRVSASIVLGGRITTIAFAELAELVAQEDLSTEWDGEPFQPDDVIPDQPLNLYAREVAWGRFDALEAWCAANSVPFCRRSGACGGEWDAERVVFTGTGAPQSFSADVDDHVVIDRETVDRLDSIDAIRGYFAAAYWPVPPLVIVADLS